MNTLITADLHLNNNPRDEYRFGFFEDVLPELLKKYDCNRALILGDLTHEKDHHNAELVNRIVNGLARLNEIVEDVTILGGNHDGYDPSLPFFSFAEHLRNVYWLIEPSEYVLKGLGRCQFLPHTRDHERAWQHAWRDDLDWVFTHNTFDGADAGGGRRLRGIDPKVLPRHVPVISGDVHVPQEFGLITYVGAPYTINFGDEYEPRVIIAGQTPKGKRQHQSIPLQGPRKHLLEITTDVDERELNRLAKRVFVGDILKIRVHLDADSHSNWQNISEKVRAWGEEMKATVHSVVPVKAVKTKLKARGVEPANLDKVALLKQYAKRNNTPKDVLKMGLKLMEKV